MIEVKGKFVSAHIMIDELEQEAMSQIIKFCNHPTSQYDVYIMPDVHAGAGVPVGFTQKIGYSIIPNMVGVDIGCGMLTREFSSSIIRNWKEEDWLKFDASVRKAIPTGQNTQPKRILDEKSINYNELKKRYVSFAKKVKSKYNLDVSDLYTNFSEKSIFSMFKKLNVDINSVFCSLGSLGSGNHYCELGSYLEKENSYMVTVHSGSRNFGLRVAKYHQNKAIKLLEKKRYSISKIIVDDILKDPSNVLERAELIKKAKNSVDFGIDLSGVEWLEGADMIEYMCDMIFAQYYSQVNRKIMLDLIEKIIPDYHFISEIESIHNYIDFDDWIIRKGAISSLEGKLMIIPLNMRDGMLICSGKNNGLWNYSAPHGAGRLMSRGKAKHTVDMDKFKSDMAGIYSTSVCNSTLDEAPDAYKDSEMIEKAISDTCIVIGHVKPIWNMKDKSDSKSWKEMREEKRAEKKNNHKKERAEGKTEIMEYLNGEEQ